MISYTECLAAVDKPSTLTSLSHMFYEIMDKPKNVQPGILAYKYLFGLDITHGLAIA